MRLADLEISDPGRDGGLRCVASLMKQFPQVRDGNFDDALEAAAARADRFFRLGYRRVKRVVLR